MFVFLNSLVMCLVSFPMYVKTAHFLLFSRLFVRVSWVLSAELKAGFLFMFFLYTVLLG
jgi:hypothetical protein